MSGVTCELDSWVDPEHAFVAWLGGAEHGFWLDAGVAATTGWSWMGLGVPDKLARVRAVPLGDRTQSADPPAPAFTGGWVGWFGYDSGAHAAGVPGAAQDAGGGETCWLRVSCVACFDHEQRRVRVWAPSTEEAEAIAGILIEAPPVPDSPEVAARVPAVARHQPEQYQDLIEQCREQIRRGNAYQLCLTTRFTVPAVLDVVASYRRLRRVGADGHGGLIFSGSNALLSASPEQFLSVRDGIVTTSPIKGTRPRGADEHTDRELAADLTSSRKERAENVMIVDLMRNDLSRVCRPGSVTVRDLFALHTLPTVHQLISTVSGELNSGVSLGALIDATFPAGSMTGAPKVSAMTELRRIERAPRGVFAGCFGFVSDSGAVELSMVIRSIVVHRDVSYVAAGGGITWLSQPEPELAEVAIKARAPLAAAGASLPKEWGSFLG